ncbi:hypothetical protein KIN20_031362 [Parelaphostrongylus tenuis]|uniref:Uncharacterized protein n=1 Tax=Parelaphostrongylus tenuis TaxID=148309 RepID=A0AAD5R5G6_PARTN|nr:hypothetical protein KIN20_031362 [Parelaphostrongylus tenuis]
MPQARLPVTTVSGRAQFQRFVSIQAVAFRPEWNVPLLAHNVIITLSLDATGVARLIFENDRTTFIGILETNNGDTISVNGKLSEGSPAPCTSSEPYIMDILIVDGEAGLSFKLRGIHVFISDQRVSIENPAIKFSTEQRLIGARADVVIQQYMQPSMVDDKKEVFVGPMKLHLQASENPPETKRKESVCDQNGILEESDDFFA